MAIISGVMQMAATGEQVEDIGEARSALTSLIGISESVRCLHPFYHCMNKGSLGRGGERQETGVPVEQALRSGELSSFKP